MRCLSPTRAQPGCQRVYAARMEPIRVSVLVPPRVCMRSRRVGYGVASLLEQKEDGGGRGGRGGTGGDDVDEVEVVGDACAEPIQLHLLALARTASHRQPGGGARQ
eukprot:2060357-Rhodomonas_salina.2